MVGEFRELKAHAVAQKGGVGCQYWFWGGQGWGVGGGGAKESEAIGANVRDCGLKAGAKVVGARVFVCAAQSHCRVGSCSMCAVTAGFVDLM